MTTKTQDKPSALSPKLQAIVPIAAFAAKGEMQNLRAAFYNFNRPWASNSCPPAQGGGMREQECAKPSQSVKTAPYPFF